MKEGFHTIERNKTVWEIPERYHGLIAIGSGAYGQVCSAEDAQTNCKVAIKKLGRPFQSATHAKRAYRELSLLKHMRHENIIGLLDVFTPNASFDEFSSVYLVTELMGADLNTIIRTQRLSDEHIKFLIYQLLRGLKYVHSAGIIHRDLKPSNIAVNEDCELKILDFGLARQADDEMTGYVATRWYRAPEIMLNWMHYNQTVDIWSVGCIMGEMLRAKTLFPGTDHIDQLNRIIEVVGTPSKAFLDKITSDEARKYIETLPVKKRQDFRQHFLGATEKAIDILEKMLELDPDGRITAVDALAHDYFKQYADPSDEPTAPKYDDSFESLKLSLEEWRTRVYESVVKFVAPQQPHAQFLSSATPPETGSGCTTTSTIEGQTTQPPAAAAH